MYKNPEYHPRIFSDIFLILRMVRMAIQNFLKNQVISMVFGLSDNKFFAFNFIKPYIFRAIFEKRSPFSIPKRPYRKMHELG